MHILHNLLVVSVVITCRLVCVSQCFTCLEHPNILQQTNKHLYKTSSCHSHPLDLTLVEYETQNHQICLIYLEVSVETGGNKVCCNICQQKQNQFKLLEHVLRSHICKVIVICHFFVFLLIIKIHSKWVHPVITSFAHFMCQALVQAPVLTYLDCFFFSFLRKCGMLCSCAEREYIIMSV